MFCGGGTWNWKLPLLEIMCISTETLTKVMCNVVFHFCVWGCHIDICVVKKPFFPNIVERCVKVSNVHPKI